MISRSQIQPLIDDIVRRYQPEKIILFGSFANGSPSEASDIDLLIIMPFEGSSIERSAMMKGEMKLRFPVDLVVRRRETVEQYIKLGDPFMTEIAHHGQVLYERAVV